ncbi:hypothetical membrane protein [Prochlorococcus marinus str. MIT 9515]|uniref:Hypothetical membrane protein n=1 Tax=Prochlorococcus marinus (strain MIT 9515) TaxID=167542 RepID=A2BW93_PROM5|nr:hypothetical protein [Prochlorococcus marinus]ABM72054.1 hypothetical membrane protein [Prochlorococcus marinus str. MIT 9515]
MEKKEPRKAQDIKNPTFVNKKLKASSNSNNKKDKILPWWVELLFVQIGLPDKWLIKVLQSKRKSTELIKNEKRLIVTFLLILAGLTYFYPVVKYSKTKLECERIAKNYIIENKNLIKIKRQQLRMLSTNFCNGGDEIYQLENLKD